MCERLKQTVLKTVIPERVSGVRIPLPPPDSLQLRELFSDLPVNSPFFGAFRRLHVRNGRRSARQRLILAVFSTAKIGSPLRSRQQSRKSINRRMPAVREIRNRGYYTDIQQSHGDQLIAPTPRSAAIRSHWRAQSQFSCCARNRRFPCKT